MKLQARNFVVRKPETIDITMFFKKFCIATRTTASEEASIVQFPPRGENCTMLASSTYDGYSVSFGEGYEFHGWITYTWVIPIKGRPTKGR